MRITPVSRAIKAYQVSLRQNPLPDSKGAGIPRRSKKSEQGKASFVDVMRGQLMSGDVPFPPASSEISVSDKDVSNALVTRLWTIDK